MCHAPLSRLNRPNLSQSLAINWQEEGVSYILHKRRVEYADPFDGRGKFNIPSVSLDLDLVFLEDLAEDNLADPPSYARLHHGAIIYNNCVWQQPFVFLFCLSLRHCQGLLGI